MDPCILENVRYPQTIKVDGLNYVFSCSNCEALPDNEVGFDVILISNDYGITSLTCWNCFEPLSWKIHEEDRKHICEWTSGI